MAKTATASLSETDTKNSLLQGKSLTGQVSLLSEFPRPLVAISRIISQKNSLSLIQPKLTIGAPNDKYEQEADRVANQVMRMPDPSISPSVGATRNDSVPPIQRFCTECQNELDEQVLIQTKATSGYATAVAPDIAGDVLHLPNRGQSLPESSRRYFEPRFSHDFSQVKIHTDSRANGLAKRINARAFTLGRNVVFGAGQYQPHNTAGQHLIAHELTHVVQQSSHRSYGDTYRFAPQKSNNNVQVQQRTGAALQGAWSWRGAGRGSLIGGVAGGALGAIFGPIGALVGLGAGALIGGLIGGLAGGRASRTMTEIRRRCRRLMERIRQHPVYRALASAARAIADEIMALARQRNNCLYYAEKLHLLLNTPEAPRATSGQPAPQGSTLERNRRRVGQAVQREHTRLSTPQAQQEVGRQEQVANASTRQWTQRRGRDNKIFYVDNSDPNNIVVQIKLRLLRGGNVTTQQDINNLIYIEDAIERVAESRGYTMDVIFSDTDGPDVFTYNVDFDRWPTSANPVGNARTLAHEIHHLMGLGDRYDYIEAHAANRNMNIPVRLHWFREQMNRQPDSDRSRSLMGSGRTMLDDDVCRVSGLDFQTCMAARARSLQE